MPCNTITQVKSEMKDVDISLLRKTISNLGITDFYQPNNNFLSWRGGCYEKLTGKLTARNETEGQQIKRAYGSEIVKQQASRFGWGIKQVSEYKYEIQKR